MPILTLTVNVPDFDEITSDELRAAVVRELAGRVLGDYIDDSDELIEGRRGDDPDDFRPSRKKAESAFMAEMRRQAAELVTQKVKQVVESRTAVVVDEVLSGTFTPVTAYGETSAPTTLRNMIGTIGTKYLTEKVDANGRSDGYDARNNGKPRLHVLLSSMIEEEYKKNLRALVSDQAAEVKRDLAGRVSSEITETVQRMLGLPVTKKA